MINLASKKDCTGCQACKFACARNSIEMQQDITGALYPVIAQDKCVECGACQRKCPALNPVIFNTPKKAYASWNNDKIKRENSASGGIASAIYSYIHEIEGISVGAIIQEDRTVRIVFLESEDEFRKASNSKYCYSSPEEVFLMLKKYIKAGKKVVLIGLPCQIAGYRKTFGDIENLYYVDLVCHGVAPAPYLQQHLSSIELSIGCKAEAVSFRTPELGTSNYYFSIYDNTGKIRYAKRSSDGDTYNIAFHRGYSYRENCYYCHYAKPERCSDITIGDYHGLGLLEPCDFNDRNVSLILVNTNKGQDLIDNLASRGHISVFERPVKEPIEGDAQLRRPTPKIKERKDFETYIRKYNGDFERTIKKVLVLKKRRELMSKISSVPTRIINKAIKVIKRRIHS